jgi:hypothetical protein
MDAWILSLSIVKNLVIKIDAENSNLWTPENQSHS